MLSRCTVPVPKESPDKKEFRFLAPLGMTYNRITYIGMTYNRYNRWF